ncbi:hypothetical protein [Desulfosporosinus sp. BG]|uniref:hypothetical protein n=1 Tax=Desulfosporosinus sp. BG TaxID=1633135 RepID=UPI00083AE57D|nr:hypothetical protein [Desulfosporosinus sp. BG]ODA39300.1 hypothetical protein DSBG_3904 [Desulfosporosinus sp. BG]
MDILRAPELYIDKDGLWYADGVLMVNKEIIMLFASHLKKAGPDKYHIDWQNQWVSNFNGDFEWRRMNFIPIHL